MNPPTPRCICCAGALADPAYRERQIAANRQSARARKAVFTSPLARMMHGYAIRVGWRVRKEGRRRDDG